MSTDILFNPAALNALKHAQLASLCKRYGLKTSVKKAVMVERLQQYGATLLSTENAAYDRGGPDTPIHERLHDIPTPSYPDSESGWEESIPNPAPEQAGRANTSRPLSDTWEVLSEGGASLLSPEKTHGTQELSSMSSWKSAANGQSLDDFGGRQVPIASLHSKSSSIRSLAHKATTLSRRASCHILSRSASASSNVLVEPDEPVEAVIDSVPPSPASTVGIPRRHSTVSILERPSTIRLVSPTPPEDGAGIETDTSQLPCSSSARNIHSVKERKSLAPLRSTNSSNGNYALSRKSMPDLPNGGSASVTNIYPSLPSFISTVPVALPLPGSFTASPPTPKHFVFGRNTADGISQSQFSAAAEEVLVQMNARLPSNASMFSQDLLKGKNAAVDKMVTTNRQSGQQAWGLAASTSSSTGDRYAAVHEKEFARMPSIGQMQKSKTISCRGIKDSLEQRGVPFHPRKRKIEPEDNSTRKSGDGPVGPMHADSGRDTKRNRLSAGPNILGSLRGSGRSLANLLSDGDHRAPPREIGKVKETKDKGRSSLNRGRGQGLSSRFGFLRNLRKARLASDSEDNPPITIASDHFPAPTMPCKTSVYAPRDPPQPRKRFDLQNSLRRSQTTNTMRPADSPQPSKRVIELEKLSVRTANDRSISTSATTVLSAISKTQSRPKLPDFGPSHSSASTSTNTLGLPKFASMSSSTSTSTKKHSQAHAMYAARPAPLPPVDITRKPSLSIAPGLTGSSTLHAPTISSLARMQATVKPASTRPLPVPQNNATPRPAAKIKPFGTASSRDNLLFESQFHTSQPISKPISHQASMRSVKSPNKARSRAQASGLNAIKSRGNLRGEVEVQQRRAEIRAKQERMAEERVLREMLGADLGTDVLMS